MVEQTFAELGEDYTGEALLVIAATVGDTRLIDNMELSFAAAPAEDETADLDRATVPAIS